MSGPASSFSTVVSGAIYYGGDRFAGHSANMVGSGVIAGRETEFLPIFQGGDYDSNTNTFRSGSLTGKPMKYIDARGTPRVVKTKTYLSIAGNGMAVIKTVSNTSAFTQTGLSNTLSFKMNHKQELENHLGEFLQGFRLGQNGQPIAQDTRSTTGLETVGLKGFVMQPKATTTIDFNANLRSDATIGVTGVYQMPVTVYDSLGLTHTVTFSATLTAVDPATHQKTWTIKAASADGVVQGPYDNAGAGVNVIFDGAGILQSINGVTAATINQNTLANPAYNPSPPLNIAWTGGNANNASINLNLGKALLDGGGGLIGLSGLQSMGTENQVMSIKADGKNGGQAMDLSIDEMGIGTITFTNGENLPGWKIPLAMVDDYNKLREISGGTYLPTRQSGDMRLSFPGNSDVGKFIPSTLEESSIDVTQSLTNMIVDNSRYSQNLKVITTLRQMLDRLNEL